MLSPYGIAGEINELSIALMNVILNNRVGVREEEAPDLSEAWRIGVNKTKVGNEKMCNWLNCGSHNGKNKCAGRP